MELPAYLDVDPRTLHLPSTRPTGADPFKLQRQVAQYGSSTEGPTVEAIWDAEDEELLQAARQQLAIFRARHSTVAS